MKKLLILLFSMSFVLGLSVIAGATYVETLDLYQYSVGGTIDWTHTYDFSEIPPYSFVRLSIVADDVDAGEQDGLYFNGNFLGYLNDMGYYTNWNYSPGPGNPDQPLTTTIFEIDPSWLVANMPVSVHVPTSWGVEIETSTLSVQSVPEPATMLLLGSGLIGLAGYGRKKFFKK